MKKKMRRFIGKSMNLFLRRLNVEIKTIINEDMDAAFEAIWEKAKSFTMISKDRGYANYLATKYICESNIPGAFVECGVWRGGSTIIMLETMLLYKQHRDIYLYDTFAGMSEPTDHDVDFRGKSVKEKWLKKRSNQKNLWCYASLEEVKKNIATTKYPLEKINFIQGKVEDTIPETLPQSIALLRLDTDWYESTKHELDHLYPLLNEKGVLILDDYGNFLGARKAVDEYIADHKLNLLLTRTDYTGRLAIK